MTSYKNKEGPHLQKNTYLPHTNAHRAQAHVKLQLQSTIGKHQVTLWNAFSFPSFFFLKGSKLRTERVRLKIFHSRLWAHLEVILGRQALYIWGWLGVKRRRLKLSCLHLDIFFSRLKLLSQQSKARHCKRYRNGVVMSQKLGWGHRVNFSCLIL